MKKIIEDLKILKNESLSSDSFLMELETKKSDLEAFVPGQFIEIKANQRGGAAFLRRPFSIHDVSEEKSSFSILVKQVGKGTFELSEKEEGEMVSGVFPLGNGFSVKDEKNVLLVGGGIGIAPLLFLAKWLKKQGITSTFLLGGRSKTDIIRLDAFKEIGKVEVTTEDGSLGEKGYVTNHSILNNCTFDKIYTCGPNPMMAAVSAFAIENNINCEVSLENTMACGIGACLCCVAHTHSGNKCSCTEGPVFDAKEIKW